MVAWIWIAQPDFTSFAYCALPIVIQIKMSLPYSQKPIDELMDELEALGGSSQVRMNSFVLLAITGDCQQVASYNIDDEQ